MDAIIKNVIIRDNYAEYDAGGLFIGGVGNNPDAFFENIQIINN